MYFIIYFYDLLHTMYSVYDITALCKHVCLSYVYYNKLTYLLVLGFGVIKANRYYMHSLHIR